MGEVGTALKSKRNILLIIIIILTIAIFVGFPNVFNLTGLASSTGYTNLTISVAGANPVVVEFISPIADTDPVENTSRTISFNVHVYDPDGFNDVNDSSVFANFTKGLTTRATSAACTQVNDFASYRVNYSCSIQMWYWDANGGWNISVRASDMGNRTLIFNTSSWFSYNRLKALVISPQSLTWPAISSGEKNATSDNHPTVVNNTGNYNGTVNITAINLIGESNSAQSITAANFTVGLTTSGAEPECLGTVLANNTPVTIPSSSSSPGNLSAGSNAGQSRYYYCIPQVPLALSTQTFSTIAGGSWTIVY